MIKEFDHEEFRAELAKKGLVEKKVKVTIAYFDGKKKRRETREIYRIFDACDAEKVN